MGIFKRLLGLIAPGKQKVNILCIGLDNSGKSTIINWLKPKKAMTADVVPTVGFSVEEFNKSNLSFTVFDMSGQGRYRNLWGHYFKEAHGVIFVMDSTDKIRLCVAKDELDSVLESVELKGQTPILFFANKMDLPTALTPVECVQQLQLDKITNKPWHIASSNALTGEGIDEGMQWLGDQISRQSRSRS